MIGVDIWFEVKVNGTDELKVDVNIEFDIM